MSHFVKEIIEIFQEHKNEKKAIDAAKYLRNKFVCLGIPQPLRKELQKTILSNEKLSYSNILEIIEELWQTEIRELHYFAIDLLISYKRDYEEKDIDFFESLVIRNSWWDSVDVLSSNVLGEYFKMYPNNQVKYSIKWNNTENIWLRRASILFQLKYKETTDVDLLITNINKNKDSNEFFLQKAIGWILREYSRVDRDFVIDFAENNNLKSLSKREALKWLKNKNLY
jgi:3-methyladenine DNA glycosylase AlkD